MTPGRYFVLKLDFSGIICSPDAEITNRSFKERLASSFRAFYNQYAKYLGRDKSKLLEHVSHENPEASLTNCVEVIKNELLDAQENDNKLLADVKGIYLLVDEYDAFSNAYIDPYYSNHGAEKVKISIDATFKAFWGRVESHLGINEIEKCFVTGISPLSLTDVGSGFNVAKNLSFHPNLAGLCGLTHTDIEAALKQTCGSDLEAKDKHLSLMTQYFNGYHFCRRSKVELMYNTETCLDYLQSVVKGQKPETVDPPNSEVSQEFVNRFASSPSAVRDFQAALKSEGNEFPLLPYTELLESFKLSDLVRIILSTLSSQNMQNLLLIMYSSGANLDNFLQTLDTENTEAAWRSLMLYFGALTFWPEDSEQFLKIPNVIAARRIAQAVLRKYGALKTLDSSLRFLESKGEIGDVLRHYRELMVQQDVAGQDFNKSEEMHRDLFYHTILRYHRPLLEYNVTKSDTKRTGRVDLLIPLSKHLILTEWKAARIKYLDVHVPGRKKPTLKAKAEVLSKYKLRDVLKLKYSDTDKFHPGETIENVIKDEAAPQLKQYVTSKEVVAKAEKGGLFLKAHVVFVVGSRHVLIWDMDCNGKLAEKPYLAQEMLDSEEDGEDEED